MGRATRVTSALGASVPSCATAMRCMLLLPHCPASCTWPPPSAHSPFAVATMRYRSNVPWPGGVATLPLERRGREEKFCGRAVGWASGYARANSFHRFRRLMRVSWLARHSRTYVQHNTLACHLGSSPSGALDTDNFDIFLEERSRPSMICRPKWQDLRAYPFLIGPRCFRV